MAIATRVAPAALTDNVDLASFRIEEPNPLRRVVFDSGRAQTVRVRENWVRVERQTLRALSTAQLAEVVEFSDLVGADWFRYRRADLGFAGEVYARFVLPPSGARPLNSAGSWWDAQCAIEYFARGYPMQWFAGRGVREAVALQAHSAAVLGGEEVHFDWGGEGLLAAPAGHSAPAVLADGSLDLLAGGEVLLDCAGAPFSDAVVTAARGRLFCHVTSLDQADVFGGGGGGGFVAGDGGEGDGGGGSV